MFGSGGRDPFLQLNKVLDQHHTQVGAVKKACWAVEDCIINNRWGASTWAHKLVKLSFIAVLHHQREMWHA